MNTENQFKPTKKFRKMIAVTFAIATMAPPMATIIIEFAKMVKEIVRIYTAAG